MIKWVSLLCLEGLIVAVLSLTKYSYPHAFVSPDTTQAVLIESRRLLTCEDTRRLKIRLIDPASGKVTAQTWHDVQDIFLDQFLKGPNTDPHSYRIEWLKDGAANLVISDCGDVIQLPSGKHFDIGSPEYAERSL